MVFGGEENPADGIVDINEILMYFLTKAIANKEVDCFG
jgi:hypothetical protein